MTIRTTPVIGAVTPRTPQIATYSLNASAIQPVVTVIEAVTPPSPAPTPPVFITVDNVASSPDNPAMAPYQIKAFLHKNQNDAVKSAARNTALAFGLNQIAAADTAAIISNKTFQGDLAALPDLTNTTVVIIPS